MNKKYDLIVSIGRFNPVHLAHEFIFKEAKKLSNNVLVLVGSSYQPRTIKDPFTYDERRDMIKSVSPDVFIEPLIDFSYDDPSWVRKVEDIVSTYSSKRIAIIGHDKDQSSSYLNYFPQWDNVRVKSFIKNKNQLHATEVRQKMFNGFYNIKNYGYNLSHEIVSKEIYENLVDFSQTDKFKKLANDYQFYQNYKKVWGTGPFITCDSLVVQSGHILMIQRGIQEGNHTPGQGLWAMPGGFVEAEELIQTASIRELREETQLKVPSKVLEGALVHNDYFDGVQRSLRGRIVTHVYMYKLRDNETLPRVKGSDDAMDAKWVSFGDFEKMQPVCFEDHFHMIRRMLHILGNKKTINY